MRIEYARLSRSRSNFSSKHSPRKRDSGLDFLSNQLSVGSRLALNTHNLLPRSRADLLFHPHPHPSLMIVPRFWSFGLLANQPHLAPDTHMPGESDLLLLFSCAEAPGCTGKQLGPT
jgi:hypothetical protein